MFHLPFPASGSLKDLKMKKKNTVGVGAACEQKSVGWTESPRPVAYVLLCILLSLSWTDYCSSNWLMLRDCSAVRTLIPSSCDILHWHLPWHFLWCTLEALKFTRPPTCCPVLPLLDFTSRSAIFISQLSSSFKNKDACNKTLWCNLLINHP